MEYNFERVLHLTRYIVDTGNYTFLVDKEETLEKIEKLCERYKKEFNASDEQLDCFREKTKEEINERDILIMRMRNFYSVPNDEESLRKDKDSFGDIARLTQRIDTDIKVWKLKHNSTW